jgi:hypothetical protein
MQFVIELVSALVHCLNYKLSENTISIPNRNPVNPQDLELALMSIEDTLARCLRDLDKQRSLHAELMKDLRHREL